MTTQKDVWSSEFGSEYTERNIYNPEELNVFYKKTYGVSREEMNKSFLLENIPKNAKILEVGCNVGNQLRMLQEMGYSNLYGLELQEYAVKRAKELTQNINIIQGVGDDIPFKSGFFDLVFTSGVLIHIPPIILKKVQSEIIRCSNRYVWGFEYFEEVHQEVIYRGNENLLWKGDFCKKYNEIENMKLVSAKNFKYLENNNMDQMFLLEK